MLSRWWHKQRRIQAIRKAQAIILILEYETFGTAGNGILCGAWVYLGWQALRESQ